MALLLTVALSTMAMSYEQARERALFLTDKMAYELNLNDEQTSTAHTGREETWISAISSSTGSMTPSAQRHISTVR